MLRAAADLHSRTLSYSRAGHSFPIRFRFAHQSARAQLGGLALVPYVPPSDELIQGAVKRASRLSTNKGIRNEAQKARNLCARQLDLLTKELGVPLGKIVRGFPATEQLHPFEQALLVLTIGPERYERHLAGVNSLRKSLLEVGKGYAAQAAKAKNKAEAYAVQEAGFTSLQSVFAKGVPALDNLKVVAQQLRRLPTVDVEVPTVALVGAPNVGKSSLVQSLSSGLPEICDYPFTTRTVKMGHFFVAGQRHQVAHTTKLNASAMLIQTHIKCHKLPEQKPLAFQVTDTPGLLHRPDEDRNAMERLTLACLQHLPTAALFVLDLTGDCGTSVDKQWLIRADLKARFPHKPWLDVLSKADLLQDVFAAADAEASNAAAACARQKQQQVPGSSAVNSPESAASACLDEHAASQSSGACRSGESASGMVQQVWREQTVWDAKQVAMALPEALRVSSLTSTGLPELKTSMLTMLSDHTHKQQQEIDIVQLAEPVNSAAAVQA